MLTLPGRAVLGGRFQTMFDIFEDLKRHAPASKSDDNSSETDEQRQPVCLFLGEPHTLGASAYLYQHTLGACACACTYVLVSSLMHQVPVCLFLGVPHCTLFQPHWTALV